MARRDQFPSSHSYYHVLFAFHLRTEYETRVTILTGRLNDAMSPFSLLQNRTETTPPRRYPEETKTLDERSGITEKEA